MRHSDSLNVFGTRLSLWFAGPLPPRASVFDLPPGPSQARGAWGPLGAAAPRSARLTRRNFRVSPSSQATLGAYCRVLDPPAGSAFLMAVEKSSWWPPLLATAGLTAGMALGLE